MKTSGLGMRILFNASLRLGLSLERVEKESRIVHSKLNSRTPASPSIGWKTGPYGFQRRRRSGIGAPSRGTIPPPESIRLIPPIIDHMGCYGSRSVHTPHMDRMAANGVRFAGFYACNAMCTPSRAGLLTGRYPQRVGLSQIIRPEPNFKSKMITKLGQTLGEFGVVDVETGGLRGSKGLSFEGGFRVPFLAQWPGRIPKDSVCREPAMNTDIFPTALALAGVELPQDRIIDGKDISGLLFSKENTSPHEALFFYHHNELEGVRCGKWKYFRYVNTYEYPMPIDKPHTPMGKIGRGKLGSWPLLYDMELDPFERYNVIETYPEIGDRMLNIMVHREKQTALNPRGWL